MQDFASRLDKILGIRPKGSVKPLIYHFKDQKDMMDTIKKHTATIELDGTIPDWAGGFYLTNYQRLYIYEHESTLEIMLHEGTHQYLNYLLGSAYRHLPMWMDDGLATCFETWDMLDATDVNLKMNRQRSRQRFAVRDVFAKKAPPLTLGQVFEKDGESWNSSKGEEMACQYAVAWSFVDYLLNAAEGKAFLKQILKRAYTGKKPARISEKIVKHYETKWKKYVKTKVLPGITKDADVEMR